LKIKENHSLILTNDMTHYAINLM